MDTQEKELSSEILVQVVPDAASVGNLTAGSFTENFSKRAHEIGQSIGEIATSIRAELDNALKTAASHMRPPDEVELKFSLDFKAEAGVIITRTGVTSAFSVTVKWKS